MAGTRKARKMSPQAEVTAQLALLTEQTDDPVALRATAVEFVRRSPHLEVVRTALGVLGEMKDPANREVFHERYNAGGDKSDSGGFVRAATVRALQPIVSNDDRPLLMRALTTYQMQGMYEICADLRSAALIAMNDLDPDIAALFAARFLNDPGNSFAGQPGISAIRLLASHQRLEPLFALASWKMGSADLIGETLRNLVELPSEMVDLLVERYKDEEDEQILLGLYDLLLTHKERARWHRQILTFLRTSVLLDLYGLLVMQIVASRDGDLIAGLRTLEREEGNRRKAELLQLALQNA